MIHWTDEKGFSFLSLIGALLVLCLLYVGYTTLGSYQSGGQAPLLAARQSTSDASCKMNQLSLEKTVLSWTVRNPGKRSTLKALKDEGIPIPSCPAGGELSLNDGRVSCSKH